MDAARESVVDARVGVDSPHAWRTAIAAFFACFVIFGVVYSFGAFFKPMAAEFRADRAQTSAVFSITACIYNLLGFAGGHLADRFGPRRVLLTGAIAMGLGLVSTSLIDRLWIGYLTYGIGIGIGVGCTYVPVLAMVGGWFERRRTAALGLAVSGVGGGTLVVAPFAAGLIVHFGWREAYVIMGFVSTLMLAACAMLIEAPPIHATTGVTPITLTRAMRSPDFLMLYVAMVLVSVSIYVPFVYLPDFAQSRGVSSVSAAALVGFIGAASVAGRLGLGSAAARAGIIPLYRTSTLILGLSFGLWIVSRTYPVMVVFTIVMGLAYGGMIALSPAVVAELFGVRGLGAMLGALYTSSAISALSGPPLAGFVIDRTGSYLWAAGLAGAAGIVAFLVLLPLGRTSETIAVAAQTS